MARDKRVVEPQGVLYGLGHRLVRGVIVKKNGMPDGDFAGQHILIHIKQLQHQFAQALFFTEQVDYLLFVYSALIEIIV